MLELEKCRRDFPILDVPVHGKKLVYLDNAATTQLPKPVLDRMAQHYRCENANVHRGIHHLSERSSIAYEAARKRVAHFIGAKAPEEIIFTSGSTASVNLVANGIAARLQPGDEILVTELEHHSNFVPWQQLCKRTGAIFRVLPVVDGRLDMDAFHMMLSRRARLVAVTQVSNLTGTVMPLDEIIPAAHSFGAEVFVDGAQGVRHEPTSVSNMDCDYYCFSGHKLMAPAGIGVLYGKREKLEALEVSIFGGGIVDVVTERDTTYAPNPYRLEAGTPNYPGAIGLAAALDYITNIGRNDIIRYEKTLTQYTELLLSRIEGIRILGTPQKRSGVISFFHPRISAYDIASYLDKYGVAVRSGTHCAQPGLRSFGVKEAVRVSPAFYNSASELVTMAEDLERSIRTLEKWA